MRNYIFLTVLILVVTLYTSGQKPELQLTFTALNNAAWVQLDSIRIMNRTQGGDATVYWPDTTVSAWVTPGDIMLYVGYATSQSVDIPETGPEVQAFRLSQ
ncbi:MAG: hypothetical protein JW861_03160, partial [Bacteroidales bacterium]|nr:hypothetical protein [Bacteroidales bacterium]